MSVPSLSRFKRCSKCQVWKPKSAEFFHRHSGWKGGWCSWCKTCRNLHAFYYNLANKDKKVAYNKAYCEANKDKKAAYNKAYREANKDEMAAYHKAYREANKDKRAAYNKAYHAANPERIRELKRARSHKRRARKLAAEGSHTPVEVWRMAEDQDHLCAYCEVPLFGEFHIEHMQPLSRGGSNGWENIAIACAPCNLQKGVMTVGEFIVRMRESERRAG